MIEVAVLFSVGHAEALKARYQVGNRLVKLMMETGRRSLPVGLGVPFAIGMHPIQHGACDPACP